MESVVTLRRVAKRYGGTEALVDLSLTVERGELLGLIGPDGAGKTTAIRVMCGLVRPDRGEVRVLGLDPVRDHRALTHQVGYLSQQFSLYGDLTIDENIAFFAEIHGVRDYGSRRERLLDMTHLAPFRTRLADRLSGGMRQKLALACTLVHEPELLLLDEPTRGVDPMSRREFWALLAEFRAQGITIVMTTPYLDEAERCSRVALLHVGTLVAFDDPTRLRAGLREEVIEVFAEPFQRALASLRALPEVVDAQAFGDRAHVRLSRLRGAEAVRYLRDTLAPTGIVVSNVRQVTPSLEDVFIAAIGHKSTENSEGAGARR